MQFLTILVISAIFIGLAVIGIAIKMFLKKDGEFKKQCSVKDPNTGESLGCTCGSKESKCHNA